MTHYALPVTPMAMDLPLVLSWPKSCEKMRCQTSNQRSCCAVGSLPGCLKDLVSISRRRVRRTLMTSMVFQSGTAKRPRLPSSTMTPEYICREDVSRGWVLDEMNKKGVIGYSHRIGRRHTEEQWQRAQQQ
jgi:hypothetical protein